MRARTIVTACFTALLLAGVSPASAAEAGTGDSMDCSDGAGGTEHVILTSPVTVAAETAPNFLMVCYSTADPGTPGQVTGGRIATAYFVSPLNTTAMTVLRCTTDYQFGVAPQCDTYAFAIYDQNDVQTLVYPTTVCMVWLNGNCHAYVPGVYVNTNATTNPALTVDTFGQNLQVDLPAQCLSVFVPCP